MALRADSFRGVEPVLLSEEPAPSNPAALVLDGLQLACHDALGALDRSRAVLDRTGTRVPKAELHTHHNEDFITGMQEPFRLGCSDGVTHNAWLLKADPDRPKQLPLIVKHAWTITARWGMGLETNAWMHNALTSSRFQPDYAARDHNRDVIVLGNKGIDSSQPPTEWYLHGSFAKDAVADLEMLSYIEQESRRRGYPIDLSSFVGVGESMGTISIANLAAQAKQHGRHMVGGVLLSMAGQQEEQLFKLLLEFGMPQLEDLATRLYRTPPRQMAYLLRTLVHTAQLPPHAVPAVLRQGIMISRHSFEPLMSRLQDTAFDIHSGSEDYVADPLTAYAKIACKHPNTRIVNYDGENHMYLTRSHVMAQRLLTGLDRFALEEPVDPRRMLVAL